MSAWFITPSRRTTAALRVFAVPCAGRGASFFYPWRAVLPEWIEIIAVQLPGREERLSDDRRMRLEDIVAALALEIQPWLDRPYIILGHSMGALIAYELARALRKLQKPSPLCLVISSRKAPTISLSEPLMHRLPDTEFVAAIQSRYNGIPQIVIDQPDLMQLLLPVLRRDIEVVETYTFRPGPPLETPLFLYGGRDDPQVSTAGLEGWRLLTTGPTFLRLFPGGHFYLQDAHALVIAELENDLRRFNLLPYDDSISRVRGQRRL